ncbi:T9SS sorting signal type C domain-containing protein [Flavobacterium fluviale]|uniref:T9SS C-terminal target domain-containing protein n=1 Tax=Flavobacterium fluviale TaxID=2249356 RepID=A0A344LVZ0_9FLAO|nr:T9SS sorting signal type C domain-containing protein [Flavobacterium fluviale]AXB58082.1 T9SS C-terminal target domain-containing protein [Flavobacterium fluviale]
MKKLFLTSVLLFPIHSVLFSNPIPAHFAANSGVSTYQAVEATTLPKTTNAYQVESHRVWINLTNSNGVFKQILIAYITGATNGWDINYDAVTMDANKLADFYSINAGKKLVIQGRALPFDPSDVVPLGYRSSFDGNMTIAIDHADGMLVTQNIYLHDKETGTIHNLKDGGYTFSTLSGVFKDRFSITYGGDKKLGVDDFNNVQHKITVASKDKIISLKSDQTALKEVSVFDITGRLLYNNPKIGTSELEISSIQSGPQILLVKTTLDDGHMMTKKVLF